MLFGRKDLIKEGLEVYRTGLNVVLRDGHIDQNELQQLNTVAAKYGLQDHHTRPLRAQAFEQQSAARLADAVLTPQEVQELRHMIQALNLTVEDVLSAAAAIQRAQNPTSPLPPTAGATPARARVSAEKAYAQMQEKSPLALITQELAFQTRDWGKAWPLITKGLSIVKRYPSREAFRFYHEAGEALYAHRDVVVGSLEKAIEVYEAQLEITPRAIPEDRAWWISYYELGHQRSVEWGMNPPPFKMPSIPDLKLYGLKQLCIIREKRGEIREAIRLCDMALNNDWSGDWLIRRDKLQKKLNKQAGSACRAGDSIGSGDA